MSHRKPLPPELRHRPFTRAEAREHGVGRGRLQASDITRPGLGFYADAALDLGWPTDYEPPAHGHSRQLLMALLRAYPGTVLSHTTAAHVFALPVSDELERDSSVHLTWTTGATTAQRRGITSHRSALAPQDRMGFSQLAVTTPERTWLDLAPWLSESELVVLGDAIINRPYEHGRRLDGLGTLEGLADIVQRAGSGRGVLACRAALVRCRVGADSPPETLTRLALVDAGLPEPQVQLKGDPADRYSPVADLGYRALKIAIQYDGKHHRTPRQQAKDARRDAWFQERGWLVIRLTSEDLQEGFIRLVALVRRRLSSAAPRVA